eukprot:scaffold1351_cov176-Amphora_coffeaeformis.AAC.22
MDCGGGVFVCRQGRNELGGWTLMLRGNDGCRNERNHVATRAKLKKDIGTCIQLARGSADFRKALSESSKQASIVYSESTQGPTLLLNLPPLLNALVKVLIREYANVHLVGFFGAYEVSLEAHKYLMAVALSRLASVPIKLQPALRLAKDPPIRSNFFHVHTDNTGQHDEREIGQGLDNACLTPVHNSLLSCSVLPPSLLGRSGIRSLFRMDWLEI